MSVDIGTLDFQHLKETLSKKYSYIHILFKMPMVYNFWSVNTIIKQL